MSKAIIRIRTRGYIEYIGYLIAKLGGANTVKIKIPKTLSLETKCPIDEGKPLKDLEPLAICTHCFTPYHVRCLHEVIKTEPEIKCLVCDRIKLKDILV